MSLKNAVGAFLAQMYVSAGPNGLLFIYLCKDIEVRRTEEIQLQICNIRKSIRFAIESNP